MDALEVDHHYGALELVAVEAHKFEEAKPKYPQPGIPSFGYHHSATHEVTEHTPSAYDVAEAKFISSYMAQYSVPPGEKQMEQFANTYQLNQMLKAQQKKLEEQMKLETQA